MKLKTVLWYFVLLMLGLILGLLLGFVLIKKDNVINENPIIDLEYNKQYEDTIIYNIEYRDSVIYELHKRIEYEKEKINALDDSATIKLFYELVESE